jgi:hypothetical protein
MKIKVVYEFVGILYICDIRPVSNYLWKLYEERGITWSEK